MKPEPYFEPGEQSDSYWCICPHCGLRTGDNDEWLYRVHSMDPETVDCDKCGKPYRAWAEHTVEYCTEPIEEPK